MYKANCNAIDGYKTGDVVPNEIAEPLMERYVHPPVDYIEEVATETPVVEEEEVPKRRGRKKRVSSSDSSPQFELWMDDYLNRPRKVVVNAIKRDDLSQSQIEALLQLEGSDKNRWGVTFELKKKRLMEA